MNKKIDQKIIHFSTVENLPFREIKKRLNFGNIRIKLVLEAFSNRKEVDHIIGRPRVCDDRITTFIEIETLKNAMLSSRHLKYLIKNRDGNWGHYFENGVLRNSNWGLYSNDE